MRNTYNYDPETMSYDRKDGAIVVEASDLDLPLCPPSAILFKFPKGSINFTKAETVKKNGEVVYYQYLPDGENKYPGIKKLIVFND